MPITRVFAEILKLASGNEASAGMDVGSYYYVFADRLNCSSGPNRLLRIGVKEKMADQLDGVGQHLNNNQRSPSNSILSKADGCVRVGTPIDSCVTYLSRPTFGAFLTSAAFILCGSQHTHLHGLLRSKHTGP